jgi:hypothetical protein
MASIQNTAIHSITSLAQRCRAEFKKQDWARGEQYFHEGAVIIDEEDADGLLASVEGSLSNAYEVEIEWNHALEYRQKAEARGSHRVGRRKPAADAYGRRFADALELIKSASRSLPHTVTQAIGRHDEKDPIRRVAVLVDSVAGVFFIETVRSQLGERRLHVVDLKETTLLRGIAVILGKPNLDAVPLQDHRFARSIALRDNLEPHHRFIERSRGLDVCDRQVHRIVGIRHGSDE